MVVKGFLNKDLDLTLYLACDLYNEILYSTILCCTCKYIYMNFINVATIYKQRQVGYV